MSFEVVLQHSEEDCGAACLATVTRHHGRGCALSDAREKVGTSSHGTTLLGLRRGAELLGFNARQVRASKELVKQLHAIPLPAIVHWKGNHWAVLYGTKKNKYVLADPAAGVRYLSERELLEGWNNGVMLLLDPDPHRFKEQKASPVRGFRYFLNRVRPGWPLFLQATAISMAIGMLALAFPITTQLLTDDVLVRKDTSLLTTVVIAVLALNVFQGLMRLVQSMLVGHFGQRLQLGLTLEFGYTLLRLPMSYFDRHRSGEVVSRLQDISRINNLVAQTIFALPSQTFVALISLTVMAIYSWILMITALTAFSVVVLINYFFLHPLQQKMRALIVEGTENQGFLVETFRGALVLKTSGATPQAWEEYQRSFGRLTNLRWKTMKLGLYRDTITAFLSSVTALGILWLGSYLVIDGVLSIGQLLAFYGLSLNFLAFLSMAVQLTDDVIGARIVMERLSGVLDVPEEDRDDGKKPWVTLEDELDVQCKNIQFHHTGRADLIDEFNFTFRGGAVTAIAGPSGCGKSTLVKLLAGLYELQSGNIRYGNFNQKDLPLECLRQQVVLVPQDAHFWGRSILENFRFSCPGVRFEDIVAACQVTGADEMISELPDTYQTVLGEFGVNLSGGQKQRLALARAIVSNPPVLILDEATDSLDPLSERQVLDSLLQHRSGKTTILISHSPRVIQRADWLLVMDKGKIQRSGATGELIKEDGAHQQFLHP